MNYYLVPLAGSGTDPDPFHPKYTDTILSGTGWSAVVYDQTAILAAPTDVGQDRDLRAQSDVSALPADLNQTVGGALATVQAELEARNIPGDWVTAGMTYRTVLLWMVRMFLFLQRLQGAHAEKFFQLAENLDTLVSAIGVARRQNIDTVAQSYGFDTSAITGSHTLRQALKIIVGQSAVPVQWATLNENH